MNDALKQKGSAGGRSLSDTNYQSQVHPTSPQRQPQRWRVVVGKPITWRRGYASDTAAKAVADRLREIGLIAYTEVER